MAAYFTVQENKSGTCLKAFSFIISFSLLIITSPLFAQPEQRIIVQFQHPLTQEDSSKFDRYLKDILEDNYKVASHSSRSRWILVIPSSLTADAINNVIINIKKNSIVKYAESDQLLRKQ
ncbi:hypothetical protein MNBD_GAMMA11-474 [hydrothermal vent metagenome]|uniref:Uncharacterized protein n=1 Tax=hydrothermal vent metagenome TaxID=652676 RepID=A0A3B0WYB2_9ZZZZ